jgi:pathogenesis-related protein 1
MRHVLACNAIVAAFFVACSGSQSGSPSETSAAPDGRAVLGTSAAQVASADAGGDAKALLDAHNRYRAAHCASPLEWSPDVAKTAQAWADELARGGCKLRHSKTNLGEDLAGGTTGTIGPERAVELWYDENKSYDFAHGGFSMAAGHFTQVVWKGSRHLGCGTATCGDKQVWVCNYDPPGNVEGQFPANVDRPTCKR